MHYYKITASLAIILELFCFYILMYGNASMFLMDFKIPIIIGMVTALLYAHYFDVHFKNFRYLNSAVFKPFMIFMGGVTMGTLANFVIFYFERKNSTFAFDIKNYFIEPMAIHFIFGIIPCLLLGSLFWYARNKFISSTRISS